MFVIGGPFTRVIRCDVCGSYRNENLVFCHGCVRAACDVYESPTNATVVPCDPSDLCGMQAVLDPKGNSIVFVDSITKLNAWMRGDL